MRKRDKLKNMEQANLMLEQSYLINKGLLNEYGNQQVASASAQSPKPPKPPKSPSDNKEGVDSIEELVSSLTLGKPVRLNGNYEENKNKFNALKMVKLKTINGFGLMKSEYYPGESVQGEIFIAGSELEKLEFFLFKVEYIDNGNDIIIYRVTKETDTEASFKSYLPKNFIPVKINGVFGVVKGEDGYNKCRETYLGSCVKLNG